MVQLNCHIIYVLKLQDDCWYVGWTTTQCFKKRMKDHWESETKGAMWTRLHKPVRVISVDTYDRSLSDSDIGKIEDAKTLHYAKLHGFDKVRGGGYCQLAPTWPLSLSKKAEKKIKQKKSRRALRAVAKAEREMWKSKQMLQ